MESLPDPEQVDVIPSDPAFEQEQLDSPFDDDTPCRYFEKFGFCLEPEVCPKLHARPQPVLAVPTAPAFNLSATAFKPPAKKMPDAGSQFNLTNMNASSTPFQPAFKV